MGYNTTATTITLTAKLTPYGRQQLVMSTNSLITSFGLGDSDANYYAANALTTGQVPAVGGDIGPNNTTSNSTTQNKTLKSVLLYNNTGALSKPVEAQSTTITSEILPNGINIVSGNSIVHKIIDRNDYATDSLVNLYYTFGLPLNTAQDTNYTGKTYVNGGYSDTALSGVAQTKILVLAIDNTTYGETIDGKVIKINLTTYGGPYTIYGTYQNSGIPLTSQDGYYRDTSTVTSGIDSNIALLFSDDILKPNGGDPSLSWGTGFGSEKPFSLNNKRLYNLQTNSNLAVTADTPVGIAYLDKGFVVITDQTIINNYGPVDPMGPGTGTTIEFNSVSTSISQNITCIANRGEFGVSTNPTFSANDVPRISEVALYDATGGVIAIAKSDQHIIKNVNDFKALGIKISL